MGSNLASFMANLFLYYHKRKWLLLSQKGDLRQDRIFSIISRFIDDLCTNNNESENNYKDIYPDELVLK